MIPIHITRHKDGRCLPIEIAPQDRSWLLYIDKEGKPSLWLDFPKSIPVNPDDESQGFFEHAYMPAQEAYQVEPDRMAQYEREMIDHARNGPFAAKDQEPGPPVHIGTLLPDGTLKPSIG